MQFVLEALKDSLEKWNLYHECIFDFDPPMEIATYTARREVFGQFNLKWLMLIMMIHNNEIA